MKIEFEGKTWQLNTENVSMAEAETIAGYTGLSLAGWEKAAYDHEDPAWLKAIKCLYWLMLAQNDAPAPLPSLNFAVLKFYSAVGEGAAAELAGMQAAEPDPTKPADGNAAEGSTPATTPAG